MKLTEDEWNELMKEIRENNRVLIKRQGKKIEVTYVDTDIKCDSWTPMRECKSPNCSWFNHSMENMAGGGYPQDYDRKIDN